MSKKTKKSGFGKRLWNSITEPIPDENDDQNNEKIPLAYDVKDTDDAKPTSSAAPSEPKKSAAKEPAKTAKSAAATPKSAAAETDTPESAAPQTRQARRQAAEKAAAKQPKPSSATQPMSAAQTTTPKSAVSQASEAPTPSRSARHGRQDQASAPTSTAPKAPAAKPTTAPTTPASAAAKSTPASQAATPKRPATSGRPASHHGQPVISVKNQNSGSTNTPRSAANQEQPEIPLSREELYGDQQPNGGKAPKQRPRSAADSAEPMSRLARHGEATTAPKATKPAMPGEDLASEHDDDGNDGNSHQKARKYNKKLMLTGVGILLIAAVGALFMWNHAKTTEATAKSNAEAVVKEIYTSTAQKDLRESADSSKLAQLQTYVDQMKQSDTKNSLQKQHDTAAKMLSLRNRYTTLYTESGLIKASVVTKDVTNAEKAFKQSSLASSKTYFTDKYQQKLKTTGKTVKAVVKYDKDYQALYTKTGKLKSTVTTTNIDTVMKNLKKYRTKSQLAANDYDQLKTNRTKLAKAESSAAAASSSAAAAYSESSESSSYSESSSSYSEPSSSSSDTDSSSTYSTTNDYSTTGNDTDTTSSTKSSSSSAYSYSHSSSAATSSANDTSSTTTSSTTTDNNTTGYNDSNY